MRRAGCLLAGAALLLTSPALAGPLSDSPVFLTGPVLRDARLVEAIDLDGDGAPDLLGGGEDLRWWSNGGPDAASWPLEILRHGYTASLEAADLDGDGDLDVLDSWREGSWSWHLAWRENRLAEGLPWVEHEIDPPAGYERMATVGDLDGDGDPDVVSTQADGQLRWFRNEGGSWTSLLITTLGSGEGPLAARDMDGDGDLDVLAAAGNIINPIRWWENLDGLGIAWDVHVLPEEPWWLRTLAPGDVDGDGDVDVVVGVHANLADQGQEDWNLDYLVWWENDGPVDGWTWSLIGGPWEDVAGIHVADLDGDGDADVAATGDQAGVAWWENELGDGSSWSLAATPVEDWDYQGLAAFDADGDGDIDLAGAHDADGVRWLENDGGSAGWPLHPVTATLDGVTLVQTADLDGDGVLDVAAAKGYPAPGSPWNISWLGAGEAGWTSTTVQYGGTPLDALVPADLDGDGDVDLAVASPPGVAWWSNDAGDGTAWSEHLVDGDVNPVWELLAGDLDGDGDVDLAGSRFWQGAPEASWFENDGGWTRHVLSVESELELLADLDGDGDLDAAGSGGFEAPLTWYENDGLGGAWTPHVVSDETSDPTRAADVDGDGDIDFVVGRGQALEWLRNDDGLGEAWTTGSIHELAEPYEFALADLDADGDIDCAALGGSGELDWHENLDGDGSAWAVHPLPHALVVTSSLRASDLDGDGDHDLLLASRYDDAVAVWPNDACDDRDGDGHATGTACPLPGPDCDDDDASAWPGAPELCDGVDNDCDPSTGDAEQDDDGDGHPACEDCDDDDPTVHPGAPELCDGLDGDCDPDSEADGGEQDDDGDGFPACADCDDGSPGVHPAAAELCDGVDSDCDPETTLEGDVDEDGDGSPACDDCDDADPDRAPGAPELCDGRDNDCDPTTDAAGGEGDEDGDGSLTCADCDDGDPDSLPGAEELCDGRDNDCDGEITAEDAECGGCGCRASTASGPGGLLAAALLLLAAARRRRTLAVPLLVAIPGLALAGTTFDGPRPLWGPGFAEPVFVEQVDLDGDGDLDVVATADEGAAWWANDGTATGWTRHDLPLSTTGASRARPSDLDGDGDLDLAVLTWDDDQGDPAQDLVWLENVAPLGDGSAWVEHHVPAFPGGARDLEVADLDGDGADDLVLAIQNAGITWWSNDGDGSTWTEQPSFGEGFGSGADLAVGDLDADGDPDLVGGLRFAGWDCALLWWENDGEATAWTEHEAPCPGAEETRTADLVDLDGDGDLDVVASLLFTSWSPWVKWIKQYGWVDWWENDGGAPPALTHHELADGFGWLHQEPADLDGDGDPDLVLFGSANAWLENGLDQSEPWTLHLLETPPVYSLAPGDLDGDGDPDLAVPDYNGGTIWWLENDLEQAEPSWPWHELVQRFHGARWVGADDLDGDGDVDLAGLASTDGTLRWLEGDLAADSFVSHPIGPAADADRPAALADLDGDGDRDLVHASSVLEAWRNDLDGGGAWEPHALAAEGAWHPAAADLDGDGDLDLLTAGSQTRWFENPGDPWGQAWTAHSMAPGIETEAARPADVNGDGHLDVVTVADDGAIAWWSGDGAGTFAGPSLPVTTLEDTLDVLPADLDGDGHLDLAAASLAQHQVRWWRNSSGDGQDWDEEVVSLALDGGWACCFGAASLAAADLDGDGDLDLAGAGGGAGQLTWWEADGGWIPHELESPFTSLDSLEVVDLEGDGDLDLVAAARRQHAIAAWTNRGCDDRDGDGVALAGLCPLPAGDCDDDDPLRTPGAPELCDGIDNDCDPATEAEGGELDGDGDGHLACDDCDDDDPATHPGAEDLCDGLDTDCDPDLPEGGELDGDGDGHLGCEDCDDAHPDVFPGAPELCDGRDNDCDDDTWATDEEIDADGDGSPVCADCDDDDPMATPGAPETCDGVDNDCDPATEALLGEGDADGDGYPSCTDCDDNNPAVHPYALELCDGVDNDCDGQQHPCRSCDCDSSGSQAPGGWLLLPAVLLAGIGVRRRRSRPTVHGH